MLAFIFLILYTLLLLLQSYIKKQALKQSKEQTAVTAKYVTVITEVDTRVIFLEQIKKINPYQPGSLTCDNCGNCVSKTYTTTKAKNALDETTRVMCDYCYCTQPRKEISIIEGDLYNHLRAKYNLGRKYFPRLINQ